MRVLLFILLAAGAAALGRSDPAFSPALIVAAAAALAAIWLLVRPERARPTSPHIPSGSLRP